MRPFSRQSAGVSSNGLSWSAQGGDLFIDIVEIIAPELDGLPNDFKGF
jgi:hypothetical protein